MLAIVLLATGGVASVLCGLLSYLASPHQRLFAVRPATGPCLAGAAGAAAVALGCVLRVRSPATAIFMVALLLMVFWSIVPALVALLDRQGRRR
ncbi:hypothetical protein [Gluconacetobacter asukensis]|uniref:Uncharacterized protein n=1 Tax=Gluconacetobacter asukensis TaxID=1017181 RepID=A0A7W4IXH5_9PROT|nr:hypothetical protein [Gluconacetobacter asukensis]MBB2170827.1 hypothetical protein [Gluconacetobacter asukensis]